MLLLLFSLVLLVLLSITTALSKWALITEKKLCQFLCHVENAKFLCSSKTQGKNYASKLFCVESHVCRENQGESPSDAFFFFFLRNCSWEMKTIWGYSG